MGRGYYIPVVYNWTVVPTGYPFLESLQILKSMDKQLQCNHRKVLERASGFSRTLEAFLRPADYSAGLMPNQLGRSATTTNLCITEPCAGTHRQACDVRNHSLHIAACDRPQGGYKTNYSCSKAGFLIAWVTGTLGKHFRDGKAGRGHKFL